MSRRRIDPIIKEDATIIWKNFSGKPDKFNPQGGKKLFNLVLTEEEAETYAAEGWNVKSREPKDGEGEILYYLPVRVNYNGSRPPKIYMVTDHNKALLDEDTVELLDTEEIESCDVEISPYPWDVGGKTGISAYLKTMFAVIAENPFMAKYGKYDDDAVPVVD